MVQIPEEFHFNNFNFRDGQLYYKGKSRPLPTIKGDLKSVGKIAEIWGKKRLRDLGFDIPISTLTARQAVMLNRVDEELPSTSDVAKANNVELQEITENTMKSTEDLITQFEGQEMFPMC